MKYPLTDDYMIYNYDMHQYILTEKAVSDRLGINLNDRIHNKNAVQAFLRQISGMIYHYIHSCGMNNQLQNYVIAKTETGRKIIQEAMENQLIYVSLVGDLSRTTDEHKRYMAIDMQAIDVLMRTIPEINGSIIYAGTMKISPVANFDDTKW